MSQSTRLGLGLTVAGWPPNPGPYPDWLPTAPSGDRPVIYADFVNGNYWAAGQTRALGDLFVQNDAWGTWVPDSAVSPGNGLDFSSGYAQPTVNHAYIGPVVSECTIVWESTALTSGSWGPVQADLLELPGFTVDGATKVKGQSGFGTSAAYWSLAGNSASSGLIGTPSLVAVAYTVYSDHTLGSINGQAATSTAVQAAPASPTDIAIAEGSGLAGLFMRWFSVYTPQPDADLPTLSTP
jgi:hypothetical protein